MAIFEDELAPIPIIPGPVIETVKGRFVIGALFVSRKSTVKFAT
jgi:hypothetical protein